MAVWFVYCRWIVTIKFLSLLSKMITLWYFLRLLWYTLQSPIHKVNRILSCPARWDKVLLMWAYTKIHMDFTAFVYLPPNHELTYVWCMCSVNEQRTSANTCSCCGKTTYQCVLRCCCVLIVSVANRNLSLQRLPTYHPQPTCFWSSGWWPWWTRGKCLCGKRSGVTIQCRNDINIFTDILLIICCRCQEMPQISVRGLFQAVRSQLHFSQLSAWWSCSKGSRPAHVNYRVTVPGEAFASQFQRQPVEHSFPVASISRGTAVKVFTKLGLI
jgi:hypothetical protein